MSPRAILLASLFAAAACAPPEPAPEPAVTEPVSPADGGLVPSLTTTVEGDTVRFELHVTNMTDDTLRLEFPSSQRFDFEVLGAGGESAWSWSAARSFAQVVGEEAVAPGETVTYRAGWGAGERRGAHTVVGRLTSTNQPIELRAEFEVPGG